MNLQNARNLLQEADELTTILVACVKKIKERKKRELPSAFILGGTP